MARFLRDRLAERDPDDAFLLLLNIIDRLGSRLLFGVEPVHFQKVDLV